MNFPSFSLTPFQEEEGHPDLRITGTVRRSANKLSIGYALLGDLSGIAIPARGDPPGRKNRLWEETCLELFLGMKGFRGYWEFNLSPAGHWNVYRFTSYRKGMREELAFPSLPIRVWTEPNAFRLSLDLEPGKIIPADRALEAGVCAVIRTVTGDTSHWALLHPASRPDFHRRDGFAFTLPGYPGI